jgi:hypothetical protein
MPPPPSLPLSGGMVNASRMGNLTAHHHHQPTEAELQRAVFVFYLILVTRAGNLQIRGCQ